MWNVALALFVLASPISGQSVRRVVISSEITCPGCRILIDTAAVLQHPKGIRRAPEILSADARGNFYAVYADARYRIHRHDPSGLPVAVLGGKGSELGSFGEFPRPPRSGAGDSLDILDRRNSRVVVLSPAGSAVRAAPSVTSAAAGYPIFA